MTRTNPVNHRTPMAPLFVYQTYAHPGLSTEEMAAQTGVAYFNLNKRAKRSIVDGSKGLVRAIRDGRKMRYYPTDPTLTTGGDARKRWFEL